MQRIMFVFFLINYSTLFAQNSSIKSHSLTNFSVYRGDFIKLKVEMNSNEEEAFWKLNDQIVCQNLDCIIDTKNLTVGQHYIFFDLKSRLGIETIKFKINILNRPGEAPIKTIAPKMIKARNQVQKIFSEDFYLKAEVGFGFNILERKTELVNSKPVLINWSEKLKSQTNGILKIERKNFEQHFLFENSHIDLLQNENGRRAIVLRSGILRSRNLTENAPFWSIIVKNWFQIDTDLNGDIIVELIKSSGSKSELAKITSLRGYSRIFVRLNENDTQGIYFSLKPGTQVILDINNPQKFNSYIPSSSGIEELIAKSTQNVYVESKLIQDEDPTISQNIQDFDKPNTLAAAIIDAKKLIEDCDPYKALAILIPFYSNNPKNYELNILLGVSSRDIFLVNQAAEFFNKAIDLKPNESIGHFEFGVLFLQEEQWQDAITSFENAKNLNYSNLQLLHYYIGISHFHRSNTIYANKMLTALTWDSNIREIQTSAENYVKHMKNHSKLNIFILGAYQYQSNFLHLSKEQNNLNEIDNQIASGQLFQLKLKSHLISLKQLNFDFNLNLENMTFNQYLMKKYNYFTQVLEFPLTLRIEDRNIDEKFFDIGIVPRYEQLKFDQKNEIQSVGGDIFIHVTGLYGQPKLYYRSMTTQEQNTKNKTLDTQLWEIVSNEHEQTLKNAGFGLSYVALTNNSSTLFFNLFSSVASYKSQNSLNYSHIWNQFDMNYKYNLSFRQSITLNLEYTQRKFYNSALDKRLDQSYQGFINWDWNYSPNLGQHFKINYESQTSNQKDKVFANFSTIFGFFLTL